MLPPPPIRGLFRTDQRARAAYAEGAGIFRILPAAVCVPQDREDLASLAHWASAHRVALVPRGAGSAMGGGNVGDGVVVDLTALPAPARGRRRRPPGARPAPASPSPSSTSRPTAAGLRLPPDPSSGRWATLGGMVSTNAAGARTVRYGSVRRWVESVGAGDGRRRGRPSSAAAGPRPAARSRVDRFEAEAAPAIRAAAELVRARFPRTRKNASGYALDAWLETGDLLDLVIGAEGTLGIVTSAEWRLDPVPAARAGLRVRLRSLDALADAVEPCSCTSRPPSSCSTAPSSSWSARRGPRRSCWSRSSGTIRRRRARRSSAPRRRWRPGPRASTPASPPAAAERLWALRHAASPILAGLPESRRSLQVIEDGCVPVERMGEYVRAVREAAAEREPRGGDLRARRRWPHPREPAPRDRRGRAGRSRWRRCSRRSPTRSSGSAARRPASTATGGFARGLLARVYGDEVMALFAPGQARLRPAGHPESRRYPSRRQPPSPAKGAPDPARLKVGRARGGAAGRHRARSPSHRAVRRVCPASARAGRRPADLTPDPTTHGNPSRAPDHPHRAPAVPRARPSPGPVEGRVERRRADRRVRRAALLHEPAQPGRPDDGRVPDRTS